MKTTAYKGPAFKGHPKGPKARNLTPWKPSVAVQACNRLLGALEALFNPASVSYGIEGSPRCKACGNRVHFGKCPSPSDLSPPEVLWF